LSLLTRRLHRAISANTAETAPDDPDPRLRGRTYPIPFDQVWQASLALAKGGLRGWRCTNADDYEGVIRAEAHTLMMRFVDDVSIQIYLDENAQTRVDMISKSRKGKADLGTNARRINRFFRALDRKLQKSKAKAAEVRKA
jgi:hypothetical protein